MNRLAPGSATAGHLRKKGAAPSLVLPLFCGDSRIRTGDPLLAKQVLYQLSYTPLVEERRAPRSFIPGAISGPGTKKAGLVSGFPVGTGRVELPTSTLSVWRSNQLS